MTTNAYNDLPEQVAPRTPERRTYLQRWRDVPGNAVYLLAIFVVSMAAIGVLSTLFWAGVGMLILVIGVPLISISLLVARGFSLADRFLLQLTPYQPIPEPLWTRDGPEHTGFWKTLTRPIRSGHYWSALLHGMLVNPILSTITFALTVTWLATACGGLTYWFWGGFLPQAESGNAPWVGAVANAVPWLFGGWNLWVLEVVLFFVGGVLFAVTMPWVLGGLASAHHALASVFLGRWRSDDLAEEVAAEGRARRAAVHAEDEALRRLERDIHDGPQQRLVRLQMDLASLERRAAAGDPDAAAQLAREAREHAKAALDELRALSSGVAPPLLQDRGLAAALDAVATACALPVQVEIDPEVDVAIAPDVARAVYFIAAELLTNAVKHAAAADARLTVRIDREAALPTAILMVSDSGQGGATPRPQHGLAGLQERVAGLRGTLEISSPIGGPTTVDVRIPLITAPV